MAPAWPTANGKAEAVGFQSYERKKPHGCSRLRVLCSCLPRGGARWSRTTRHVSKMNLGFLLLRRTVSGSFRFNFTICAGGRHRFCAHQERADCIQSMRWKEIRVLIERFETLLRDCTCRTDRRIAITFPPSAVPKLREANAAIGHDIDRGCTKLLP